MGKGSTFKTIKQMSVKDIDLRYSSVENSDLV